MSIFKREDPIVFDEAPIGWREKHPEVVRRMEDQGTIKKLSAIFPVATVASAPKPFLIRFYDCLKDRMS